MSLFIKRQNKIVNAFKKTRALHLTRAIIMGIPFLSITANAAIFEESNDQLILKAEPNSGINNFLGTDFDGFSYFNNLQNIKVKKLTKQGLEQLKAGHKQQGLQNLHDAWNLNPNFVPAGVMLSLNLLKNKEYQQALKIAKEIQQAKTQDQYGLGYTLEGMVHAINGELDKAVVAFKEAIHLIPSEKNALLNLAILVEAKKHHTDAKTYLQKILDLEPTHLKALENLAKIEFILGDTEKLD